MEDSGELNSRICSLLEKYTENFHGLGKIKNYQAKLYINNTVKPIALTPRPIPYHLKARVDDVFESMKDGVIEEYLPSEPTPLVSCAVIVPKSESYLRITLYARNLNKVLISSNYPIPHQEDIRAHLSGATYFCKLAFKSAFWQLELDTDSRGLTVFRANNKLCH